MSLNKGLERFIEAQKSIFNDALHEIQAGKKRSHWMWFVFPQLQGLGFSEMSNFYGISDLTEAARYLQHRVLGPRLILISSELLKHETNNAYTIMGRPDDLKLHSCMTLFSLVPGADPVFRAVIDKFFSGLLDNKTLKILSLLNTQS